MEETDHNSDVAAAIVGKPGGIPAPISFLEHVKAVAWAESDEVNGGGDAVVRVTANINQRQLARWGMTLADVLDFSNTSTGLAAFDISVWEADAVGLGVSDIGTPSLLISDGSAQCRTWNDPPIDPADAVDLAEYVELCEYTPAIVGQVSIANALGAGPGSILEGHVAWRGMVALRLRIGALNKYGTASEVVRRWNPIVIPVVIPLAAAWPGA